MRLYHKFPRSNLEQDSSGEYTGLSRSILLAAAGKFFFCTYIWNRIIFLYLLLVAKDQAQFFIFLSPLKRDIYRSFSICVGEIGLRSPTALGPNAVSLSRAILSRPWRWFAKCGTFDGYCVWQKRACNGNDIFLGSKLAIGVFQRRVDRFGGLLRGWFSRTCEHV